MTFSIHQACDLFETPENPVPRAMDPIEAGLGPLEPQFLDQYCDQPTQPSFNGSPVLVLPWFCRPVSNPIEAQAVGSCSLPREELTTMYADLAQQSEDWEGAAYWWNQAVGEDPYNLYYYWGRGVALANLGNLDEAAEDFKMLHDWLPEEAAPLFVLLQTEIQIGKMAQAEEHLAEFILRFPDDIQGKRYLGFVKVSQEKYSEGLKILNEVLKADGSDVEALVARGAALLNLGRMAEGRADIKAALEMDPAHELAQKYLAVLAQE